MIFCIYIWKGSFITIQNMCVNKLILDLRIVLTKKLRQCSNIAGTDKIEKHSTESQIKNSSNSMAFFSIFNNLKQHFKLYIYVYTVCSYCIVAVGKVKQIKICLYLTTSTMVCFLDSIAKKSFFFFMLYTCIIQEKNDIFLYPQYTPLCLFDAEEPK